MLTDGFSAPGWLKMRSLWTAGIGILLFFCAGVTLPGAARQQPTPAVERPLPVVISATVPKYPPIATQARVQGEVELRITTDGQRVADVQVVRKNPLFDDAARAAVSSWQFALHTPSSFSVLLHFRLRDRVAPAGGCYFVDAPLVQRFTLPMELDVFSQSIVGICEGPLERMSKRFTVSTVLGTVVCDCPGRHSIADASVFLSAADGVLQSSTRTDARGAFRIATVPGGMYDMYVDSLDHYQRGYRVRVVPEAHDNGTIDVALKPNLALQQFIREHPREPDWTSAAIPTYPLEAIAAGIEGTVRVSIAGDGATRSVVEGDPVLARAAAAYEETWKALPANGQPFDVRLTYKLLPGDCAGGGPYVVVKFPYEVEIAAKRPLACGR